MEIKCSYSELVDIDSLIPNPKNTNDHPKKQIEVLAKIIKQRGFRHPIIVSNRSGFIVAGHGRLEAARILGINKIPIDKQDFENEADEYAFLEADNHIARYAEFNQEKMLDNLKELDIDIQEFDFEEIGMIDFELPEIEKVEGLTDEDSVPELKEEPITKRGDIWLLGNHRLMCGDSTMIDDVEKLMNGEKADITFTSPPYNANAKTGDGDIFGGKKSKNMYQGRFIDNQSSLDYVKFAKDVIEICFQYTDGFIFWNVSYNAKSKFEYISQINDRLDYLIEQVCWKKSSTIPFKGMLMRDWEPIYIFSTNKQNLNVKKVTSNFWQVNNTDSQQENHKACFPVALPEKGINLVNENTGIVFEPFCGSGSTLIACEKTNRKCYGMELDEHYCDVIINRWQEYTGKSATLESNNKSYDTIKAEGIKES